MRVGHCQAPKLDESQPEKSADMAQLVERTLGKGEVPSSTLGISTIEKNEALQIAAGLFVLFDNQYPPKKIRMTRLSPCF